MEKGDQKSLMMATFTPSKLAPYVWYSHSISTFRRYYSLFMSTLSAFSPRKSACLAIYSFSSYKEWEARQSSPWRRWWRSFSCWQTARKPQSIGFSSLGSACSDKVRFFSSYWKECSLSGQQCSSTREHRRLSYISQKQGKQLALLSWPFKVLLKKLQSSSLRFSLGGMASWGDSTSLTISRGIASSILRCCQGSSSSSNSTGRHSLTQKLAFPYTSQNSGLLAIFSHLLKSTHLLLRNFSSKTNLQATSISQAMMMLRKLESVLNSSPLSPISWSSFRISFLILPRRASYLLFRTRSCPKRQRQNSSNSGNSDRLSSQSLQFMRAQIRMSAPQRLVTLPSAATASSAQELSVRLASLSPSRQQLRKLSLMIKPMISYSSVSSPCGVRRRKGRPSVSETSSNRQLSLENLISVTILRAFISAIWQWKETSWRGRGCRYSRPHSVQPAGISLILILIEY